MSCVPGRDEEPTAAPEHAAAHPVPVLPATVAATHLAACATELANTTDPAMVGASVTDLGELAVVLTTLLTGQRQIAVTLANLADRLGDRPAGGALALVDPAELGALAEVLGAASAATGHAADALAEGGSVLDIVRSAAGGEATF